MPQQFIRLRRPAALALSASLAVPLAVATLSGCSHPSSPQKAPIAAYQETLTAAQLEDCLVPAPTGSKSDDTMWDPGSILGLDQVVDGLFLAESRAAEKGFLQTEDFKFAAETNWEAKDGTGAEIYLIEFSGSEGARDYAGSATSSDAASTRLSTLPGIPGSTVSTANSADSYGDIVTQVRFPVGNIAVDLHYYAHATADISGLTTLALAQYTRLAKSLAITPPALS